MAGGSGSGSGSGGGDFDSCHMLWLCNRDTTSMDMSRVTRDGTAEPVSRDQLLRREGGQGNIHFPCSADHEQDWQPYPVDPYSCYMCDHTCIDTYIHVYIDTYIPVQEFLK